MQVTQNMSFVAIALVVNFASIVCCHTIAKARGAKPVFWGVMGGLFGPFAIPFAYFAQPAAQD